MQQSLWCGPPKPLNRSSHMQPQLRVPGEFDTAALKLQRWTALTIYDALLLSMIPVFGALTLLTKLRFRFNN
jgi:hypothetical protein